MTNDQLSIAFISLGSNMGDREVYLRAARERFNVLKVSGIYETEPWPADVSGRQWFLNQVLEIRTDLLPIELLDYCKKVEAELGRQERDRWGDREIDIDILVYNEGLLSTDRLTIPHGHMKERRFILEPLVQIAPELKDPVTGELYTELLKNLSDEHKVKPFQS